MLIFIKFFGASVAIDTLLAFVNSDSTLSDLHRLIRKLRPHANVRRLLLSGRELVDETKSLAELKVSKECTIQAVCTLGDAPPVNQPTQKVVTGSTPCNDLLFGEALLIYLHSARNLESPVPSSVCDPFVVCLLDDQHTQSSTKFNTNNPDWNEQLCLFMEPNHRAECLSVMLFDNDDIDSPHPIGQLEINLSDIMMDMTLDKVYTISDTSNIRLSLRRAPLSSSALSHIYQTLTSLQRPLLPLDWQGNGVELGHITGELPWTIAGSNGADSINPALDQLAQLLQSGVLKLQHPTTLAKVGRILHSQGAVLNRDAPTRYLVLTDWATSGEPADTLEMELKLLSTWDSLLGQSSATSDSSSIGKLKHLKVDLDSRVCEAWFSSAIEATLAAISLFKRSADIRIAFCEPQVLPASELCCAVDVSGPFPVTGAEQADAVADVVIPSQKLDFSWTSCLLIVNPGNCANQSVQLLASLTDAQKLPLVEFDRNDVVVTPSNTNTLRFYCTSSRSDYFVRFFSPALIGDVLLKLAESNSADTSTKPIASIQICPSGRPSSSMGLSRYYSLDQNRATVLSNFVQSPLSLASAKRQTTLMATPGTPITTSGEIAATSTSNAASPRLPHRLDLAMPSQNASSSEFALTSPDHSGMFASFPQSDSLTATACSPVYRAKAVDDDSSSEMSLAPQMLPVAAWNSEQRVFDAQHVQSPTILALSLDTSSTSCLCVECLRADIALLLEQKDTSQLQAKYSAQDVRDLMNSSQFSSYLELTLKALVETDQTFVKCPHCSNSVELRPVADAHLDSHAAKCVDHDDIPCNIEYVDQCPTSDLIGIDNLPLQSDEVRDHYMQYRLSCPNVSCLESFCGSCLVMPYHTGFDCAGYKEYVAAPKCRFCRFPITQRNQRVDSAGVISNACNSEACGSKLAVSCCKTLCCGHSCFGYRDEPVCPPCLHPSCSATAQLVGVHVDEATSCVFCTEELGQGPVVVLDCAPTMRHVFHHDCVKAKLEARWSGAAIDFSFLNCPLCARPMRHVAFQWLLNDFNLLYRQVLLKALERTRFDGFDRDASIVRPNGRFFNNAAAFALHHYAFFQCFQCRHPYFGGARMCEAAAVPEQIEGAPAAQAAEFKPQDLVCVSCKKLESQDSCARHGTEYLAFKCRFCCSVGTWLCWGKTHFCDRCHTGWTPLVEYLTGTNKKRIWEYPQCPGIEERIKAVRENPAYDSLEKQEEAMKLLVCDPALCPMRIVHPPNGLEYGLGCVMCRDHDAQQRAEVDPAYAASFAKKVRRKVEMGVPDVSASANAEEQPAEDSSDSDDDAALPAPLLLNRSFSDEERWVAERAAVAEAAAAKRAQDIASSRELSRSFVQFPLEWVSPQCLRTRSQWGCASSDWCTALNHKALNSGVHFIEVEVEVSEEDTGLEYSDQSDSDLLFQFGLIPESVVTLLNSGVEIPALVSDAIEPVEFGLECPFNSFSIAPSDESSFVFWPAAWSSPTAGSFFVSFAAAFESSVSVLFATQPLNVLGRQVDVQNPDVQRQFVEIKFAKSDERDGKMMVHVNYEGCNSPLSVPLHSAPISESTSSSVSESFWIQMNPIDGLIVGSGPYVKSLPDGDKHFIQMDLGSDLCRSLQCLAFGSGSSGADLSDIKISDQSITSDQSSSIQRVLSSRSFRLMPSVSTFPFALNHRFAEWSLSGVGTDFDVSFHVIASANVAVRLHFQSEFDQFQKPSAPLTILFGANGNNSIVIERGSGNVVHSVLVDQPLLSVVRGTTLWVRKQGAILVIGATERIEDSMKSVVLTRIVLPAVLVPDHVDFGLGESATPADFSQVHVQSIVGPVTDVESSVWNSASCALAIGEWIDVYSGLRWKILTGDESGELFFSAPGRARGYGFVSQSLESSQMNVTFPEVGQFTAELLQSGDGVQKLRFSRDDNADSFKWARQSDCYVAPDASPKSVGDDQIPQILSSMSSAHTEIVSQSSSPNDNFRFYLIQFFDVRGNQNVGPVSSFLNLDAVRFFSGPENALTRIHPFSVHLVTPGSQLTDSLLDVSQSGLKSLLPSNVAVGSKSSVEIACSLLFCMSRAVRITHYDIVTTDEVPARDPVSWRLFGCNRPPSDFQEIVSISSTSGPWVMLDQQFIFPTPLERHRATPLLPVKSSVRRSGDMKISQAIAEFVRSRSGQSFLSTGCKVEHGHLIPYGRALRAGDRLGLKLDLRPDRHQSNVEYFINGASMGFAFQGESIPAACYLAVSLCDPRACVVHWHSRSENPQKYAFDFDSVGETTRLPKEMMLCQLRDEAVDNAFNADGNRLSSNQVMSPSSFVMQANPSSVSFTPTIGLIPQPFKFVAHGSAESPVLLDSSPRSAFCASPDHIIECIRPFPARLASIEFWIRIPPDSRACVILGSGNTRLELSDRGHLRFFWRSGLADVEFNQDLRSDEWMHLAIVYGPLQAQLGPADSTSSEKSEADADSLSEMVAGKAVVSSTPASSSQQHKSKASKSIEPTSELRLFRNGAPVQNVPISVNHAASFIGGGVLRIGGDHRSGNAANQQRFRGAMAELRMWSVSLTSDDINARMLKRACGDEQGLISCFSLDEPFYYGHPTVFRDRGPYANHGWFDRFSAFAVDRHQQLRGDLALWRKSHPWAETHQSSSVDQQESVALIIRASKGCWLRVNNVLGSFNGLHLNTYSVAFSFRLSAALPPQTVCLLFHPDASPEMLSTSLLIDDQGRLSIGEYKLPVAPRLLGTGWHHVAITVSLAQRPELSEYRVYIDGRSAGLARHSALLDLSADYFGAIRDCFCVGVVTPRRADLLADFAGPVVDAAGLPASPLKPRRQSLKSVSATDHTSSSHLFSQWLDLVQSDVLPDVELRDLTFQHGILSAPAVQRLAPRSIRVSPLTRRTFEFVVDDAVRLPNGVVLRGGQSETFCMDGGVFICEHNHLDITHDLPLPDAFGGDARCGSFTIIVDISLDNAPERQAALISLGGLQSTAIGAVQSSMLFADEDDVSSGSSLAVQAGSLHRLAIVRDVHGVCYYYIDGSLSHTRRLLDGPLSARCTLGPTISIFASSNAAHMRGGIIRRLTVCNYALPKSEILLLVGPDV